MRLRDGAGMSNHTLHGMKIELNTLTQHRSFQLSGQPHMTCDYFEV